MNRVILSALVFAPILFLLGNTSLWNHIPCCCCSKKAQFECIKPLAKCQANCFCGEVTSETEDTIHTKCCDGCCLYHADSSEGCPSVGSCWNDCFSERCGYSNCCCKDSSQNI